ncbi:GGDEF domain-containing protein [Pseudoteredinibacter isoporae]|uniref:diguanylate cyclase n=1 Tax=Pseudoteredinibacter isoporae TaxID=570281 RepID=A0A7X0JVN9_9GAMM|nr:GGDEF domain-containing protein [Pseudoteredinibacter isoporae]MBB6523042.1 diguanylate cyclase (GGDEF)-like protein [Pseudoteredinibacter isoporae]NHO88563.1 GGDEF domain-containing protein [Pseudoteredinibacter isoporae]NIB22746.1 GGDEF domain-containing protein [Pseudoteredinibacter isoporae]
MYQFELSKWNSAKQYQRENRFKVRVWLFVIFICCCIYTPLTIVNYYSGLYTVCAFNIAFIFSLITAGGLVYFTQKPPPFYITFINLFALVGSATVPIYYMGITGALWCHPIMAAVFFVLPWRIAAYTNSAIFICACVFCMISLEPKLYIRMITSLMASYLVVGFFSARIRRIQAQLREASNVDPMTGAFNRRMLPDMLQESFAKLRRHQESSVIAVFDLDYFKSINDNRGHAAGDQAIIEMVEEIKSNTRNVDNVYRLGGDEILLHLRDIEEAEGYVLVNKLVAILGRNAVIGTSSSAGLASISSDIRGVDEWLHRADVALYKAKELGRNQVVAWKPELESMTLQ